MPSLSALSGILKADGRRLARDRFLHGLVALILGMCLALRYGLPAIAEETARRWDFDLTAYFPLLAGHISVVLPTVSIGLLGGFILLESREEQAAKALLVTPVPMSAYLAVVGTVMALACGFLSLVHAAIIGLALPPLGALFAIGLAGSVVAPAKAFFLASAADNKVEAMAYSKVVSGAAPIALAAYFLPEPWQVLAGVYPPYWAAKAYWIAEAGGATWPFWALGAPITSIFWLWLLGRRFVRVAHG